MSFNRVFYRLFTAFVFLQGLVISARDLNSWNQQKESQDRPAANSVNTQSDLVNWPTYFGRHNTGEVIASFDCFGNLGLQFGYAGIDLPYSPYFSFGTPVDQPVEYLYGGAVWVGGVVNGDTLVSVGFDGWQNNSEFYPPQFESKGSIFPIINYPTDYSLRGEFADTIENVLGNYSSLDPRGHVPLNLKIANRSHAWHTSPENGTIIYDLVITNIGNDTIQNGAVGFLIDADVGAGFDPYSDDFSGSIKERGIAYVIDNDGDLPFGMQIVPAPKIFAVKFLNNSFNAPDTNFSWWYSNPSGSYDFGPRLRPSPDDPYRDFGTGGSGTPEGDKNKYYVMRHKEWDYDAVFFPTIGENDSVWLTPPSLDGTFEFRFDARFVLSLTPFRLDPDSSIRVLFATFTGDSVHTDPNNINNLPLQPDIYLSNLNYDDMLVNASVSDSLAEVLLDPHLPATGLKALINSENEPELQWDPWVFGEVTGYEVLLEEADLTQLPHPGAIPPWWAPSENAASYVVGRTHRLNLDSLNSEKYYLTQARHLLPNGFGEFGQPVNFKLSPAAPAPVVPLPYAAANPGQPLKLVWSNSGNPQPHHFLIYKFPDSVLFRKIFHPFYDNGYFSQYVAPKDTFEAAGQTFYYYAVDPYAIVDGTDSVFFDANFTEGETYVIASADEYGFESEFSQKVTGFVGAERIKDVLIVTNSRVVTPMNYVYTDSILSFYDSLLPGLDFDIYSINDELAEYPCYGNLWACEIFQEFLPYNLVVFDDHLRALISDIYLASSSSLTRIFQKILANGCKVAFFGPNYSTISSPIGPDSIVYYPYASTFGNIFGAGATFSVSERYYYSNTTPPYIDSLFGFINAEQIDGTLPSVNFEVNRDPFQPRLRQFWPMITPPGVSTFIPSSDGEITHVYRSLADSTSVQEGHAAGIRKHWPLLETQSYIFGFHLYYMDSADARELIEAMLYSAPFAAGAKTTIEPNKFDLENNDTTAAKLFAGELELGYQISDLNLSSLQINYSMTPTHSEMLASYPGFIGPVLKISLDREEFLDHFGIVWDSQFVGYTISGLLQDDSEFRARGTFTIYGYTLGDLDNNDWISILDINILVGYLYRNHPAPNPAFLTDFNLDGITDIQDVTRLVDHIFRGFHL